TQRLCRGLVEGRELLRGVVRVISERIRGQHFVWHDPPRYRASPGVRPYTIANRSAYPSERFKSAEEGQPHLGRVTPCTQVCQTQNRARPAGPRTSSRCWV